MIKTYATIESKIVFIDAKDYSEFIKLNQPKYSITLLDEIYYTDGNIIKLELIKSKSLKEYNHLLSM